ncbi:translocation/assembly module TamB domain-containing protein [Oceaniglobus indicus]|uniref:translocation/assembly module TamB domain-containing protein n=1 Tax=Oceaniglobus indicus TaxID=2047749 RepID=UPI000C1955C6|nr:translocation/assembly module TamB domain-containing protein [Oceaniglobus indicus]
MTAWAQSADEDDGGGFLERLIEDNLSGAGRNVDIRGFRGALSSKASLDQLTISDEDGVWLTLRGATLDWKRSALLRGRLEVEELSAEEILLPRLPRGQAQADAPAPEATPFSLPDLPVSVQIQKILAERVELGAALFGAAADVSLDGSMSLADGEGAANLSIERIDGKTGALTLDASFENATSVLALDLGLREGADGIAANLLNLPGRPSVELSVEGAGPLSEFAADIRLATNGEDRLSGRVALSESGEGETATRGFTATLGGDLAPVFAPQYHAFFGPEVRLETSGRTLVDGGFRLDRLDLNAQALTLSGMVEIGAGGLPEKIDVTGEIASDDGSPVLLPVAGGGTRVGRAGLSVQFDAAESEDWTGNITIRDLDLADLDIAEASLRGTGRIAETDAGGKAVSADLEFAASGLEARDPGVQQALGRAADGAVTIEWESGEPVRIETIRVTGASFALNGDAIIDATGTDGPVATLNAKLQAGDFNAFSGLAGRTLGGSGDLDLTADVSLSDAGFDIALDGTVDDARIGQEQADALLAGRTLLTLRADRDETGTRLSTLTVENPAVTLNASADLKTGASTLRADIAMADTSILDGDLSGPAKAKIDATQRDDAWDYTATVVAPETTLESKGTVANLSEPVRTLTSDTRLNARDISVFAALTGRDLNGAANLSIDGVITSDLQQAAMTVEGTLLDLRIGDGRIDPLLAGRTELETRILRNEGSVTVENLTLNGQGIGLRVEGSGSAENVQIAGQTPAITADMTIAADDLAPFSGLAGRDLGGALDAAINGRATIDGSEVDATVKATGRSLRAGMAEIDPIIAGLVELDADIVRTGDTISVNRLDLNATGPGLRLAGSGTATGLTGAAPLIQADAKVAVDDLSKFSNLAKRDLAGALDLDVDGQVRTDLSVLDVVVDGTARSVKVGQENADRLLRGVTELGITAKRDGDTIALPRFNLVNPQIRAEADGRYAKGESALRADVVIADLRDLDARMQGNARINLFAEETGEVWQVSLDGEGAGAVIEAMAEVRDPLSGNPTIDGSARLNAPDLSRFAPLVNRPLRGSVNATANGNLRADLGKFDVTADVVANNLRTGIAEADKILGGRTNAQLRASRTGPDAPINVQRLDVTTPMLTVNANGAILGSGSNLTFDARLADVGAFVEGFNGPVTAQGRVSQSGSNLGLNVTGSGPGGMTLRADGTIAQDFSRANIDASGSAPLGLADPFISPRSIDGTLNYDVSVNGPLALSSVRGTLSSSDARVVVPSLAIVIEDISLRADIANSTVRLDVRGRKQAGGEITASGPISLTGGLNADLAIRLAGIVVEDPRLYRTTVDGALSVTGPLAGGARIAGRLDLDETEIRIPSTGLGATGPIPDGLVHVAEPADVRATRRRAGLIEEGGGTGGGGGTARPYPIDVTIVAENRIFIRGRGLDAELGGSLTIGGTTANIIPSGQFELIRGRLDLLGKRLTMDEGQVTLQGDFTPYIRLVARTDAGDTVVLIVIEGDALAPDIDFRSEPELPEDEVLARLLFGKSISSISPLQAAQLASAVATLAGKGGDGVVSKLRDSFGLDDLDITTDEDGNAGVRAGAYLSENVYTDVTVEAGGEAEINLNLDLTDSLTVRGGASNSGETSLGIFFEKDY